MHNAITVAVALNRPEIVAAFMDIWKYHAFRKDLLPAPIELASTSDLDSTFIASETAPEASTSIPVASEFISGAAQSTFSMFERLLKHSNTAAYLADVKEHEHHFEHHSDLTMKSLVRSNRLEDIESLFKSQHPPLLGEILEKGARFGLVEVVAKAVYHIFSKGEAFRELRKDMFLRAGRSAAERGHARVLEFLLDRIANLHISERRQMFPMHPLIIAAERGFVGIAGVIFEPTAINKHPTMKQFYEAFEIAALQGHTEFLEVMLHHRAVSKDRIEWVSWLMACAASKGHDCVVRLLQRRIFNEKRIKQD